MNVLTRPTAAFAAAAVADLLADAVAADPELVIALPTGRTMVPFYDELARRHRRGEIDLGRARGFNLDELLIPAEHPQSFHSYMVRHAWGRTGLRRERCDIPDPGADATTECARYDRALAAAGGLDVAVVGVGADGHVAYNLPGQTAEHTHVVEVPAAVAATVGVAPPLRAITMGLGPLRTAGHLILLATTEEKAHPVRLLLEGPEDPAWPCTLLRRHPRFDLVLTPEAAGALAPAAGRVG
ncbi:MAG TPA: 6-phosphogluconolactonase [Thermoanaerobaculia bacterium]|nr:6-phosphogluconolactonase [Thermoanaerobaculia bacterium]